MNRLNRVNVGWALKLWVLATVFVWYFLEGWENWAWVALGGVFALVWWVLPEVPEAPVEPLPFAREYKDRAIPMPPKPEEPGFPPTRE
jgi:hypothetical protein